ncbi:MAG TPA: VIT domain-containing protein [Polyangia bacterium]|nr:VIT domain-containing protein [Polyangia bacterium]
MKRRSLSLVRMVVSLVVLLASLAAAAQADPGSDRTESAYFVVTSDGAGADTLPLKESRADIQVAGVIAQVRVTQVYRNQGPRPLEAVYVFPGSTRAAVSALRMKIGDRTIEADVKEREAARRTYEVAREEGRTASLLEQHRPNVFQMSVANILPGDTVEVELTYSELLVPTDGVYELVYPAVVGPRFTGEQTRAESWTQNPYLGEGAPEPYRYQLAVRVHAGMPIQEIASPSHQVAPRFTSADTAEMALGTPGDGNRDFVLRYRLRGGAIQTGLLRYEGRDERFFLLMMQPPARVAPQIIPPREYVFIVDVSGSMNGFPLDVSKQLIGDLLRGLRPTDRFNLLFFSGGSYQMSEQSVTASPDHIARALGVLASVQAGGGTELLGALRKALAMPSAEGTSRTFVAITDGFVPVEEEAFDLVRQNLGRANFFAFGIGSSVNRHLIEGLARAGMGESFVVLNHAQAPAEAARFRKMIESPILTNIRVDYAGMDAYDVDPEAVPDLLAERPLIIVGKYRGDGRGAVTVRGTTGEGRVESTLASAGAADPKLGALVHLWARRRVAELSDRESFGGGQQRDAIAALGVRYHLLTQYTSFVAVDTVRRRGSADLVTVRQPVPLPQGVTRMALENAASGGDEEESPLEAVESAARMRMRKADHEDADLSFDDDSVGYPGNPAVLENETDVRSAAVSALTVAPLTVELGNRVQVTDQNATTLSLPTLVRLGLPAGLEARLASSLVSLDGSGAHRPDLTVGAKAQLVDGRQGALGLLGEVRFDFDDQTDARRDARLGLLGDLGAGRLALRTNASLLYLTSVSRSRYGFGYAGELSWLLAPRWLVFVANSGQLADQTAIRLEVGTTLALTGSLLVGVDGSAGLTEAAERGSAAFILRWRL